MPGTFRYFLALLSICGCAISPDTGCANPGGPDPITVNTFGYPKIAATCNMRTTPYLYLGDTASELLHRFNREKGHNTSRTAKGFTDTFRMSRRQLESLYKPNTYTGICHSRTSIRGVRGYTRWPGKRLWGPR